MPLHAVTTDEAIKRYSVAPELGLTDEQVEKNRQLYGRNELASKKPKSLWILLFEQFNNPFIYILVVAAILNALIADLKDTIVIGVVVVLNTIIGFIQEQKASDALKSLKKMASPNSRVIRNGKKLTIPANEVVCGDIILLESGMRAPADARLIESQNLLVDESMLTGESFPITKNAEARISKNAPLGNRVTMVYSGTVIQKGRGTAVVAAVGKDTEFGQISTIVAEVEETVSPLQTQIIQLSKILTYSIMGAVIAIFAIGSIRGIPWLSMLLTSVGLAVSAIPEGLPVAVTITLTIGISLMAKHNAVVKKLAAVETLGSTNIICTDKTGTLTKNQMTVSRLFLGDELYKVSGSGYSNEGEVTSADSGKIVKFNENHATKLFSMIAMTCTESAIALNGQEWEIIGDPTEGALMIAAEKLDFKCTDCRVYVDIPFESENQLMAVKVKHANGIYVFIKGAPERILERCVSYLGSDGNEYPINLEHLKEVSAGFSKLSLRVLALAKSKKCEHLSALDNTELEKCPLSLDDLKELSFVGFAGIQDAVRPEAIQAVEECHSAGVRVVMITGDHAQTAKQIAKEVKIGELSVALTERGNLDKRNFKKKVEPIAITGTELDEMSDVEFFNHVDEIDVYARVAPQHKFRIVKNLQARGNVVAMTGDGVNDSPALKQADIGVSMGSGTEVAKDSSHIVLMDDNFATIVQAVRRGRVVLHNLRHILLYILATSVGGVLTIAVSVLFGFPLPILPAQLLWINLVTDGTSTFPLAFEKEHGNVMAFPPRKKNVPLITNKIIKRIIIAGSIMMLGTIGVYFFFAEVYNIDLFSSTANDYGLAKIRTLAFSTLAFFQIWNVQNSRSLDRSLFFRLPYPGKENLDRVSPQQNPILLAVMLLAMALQVSAVALPFMNNLLRTTPLNTEEWFIALSVSFSIIIIIEAIKFVEAFVNTMTKRKNVEIDDVKGFI